MDSNLFLFYKTLNSLKFKYFIVENAFHVFNSDIQFLPMDLQVKASTGKMFNNIYKIVRLQEIENIVRELLVNKKIPVEEYEGTKLMKRGHPSNYGDFLSICLSDTIIPTVGCVVLLDNLNQIEFAYFRDEIIYITEYVDDDLLSKTYTLTNTYNCIEILYSKKDLERFFVGWGITPTFIKNNNESCELIMKTYLGNNYNIEKFQSDDICVIDIEQFDLVDFGCETMQGRRLLNQWIRSPTTSLKEINKRLDMVEAFSEMNISLDGFCDLKRISHKIGIQRVTISETIKLYQMICEISDLENKISIFVEKSKNKIQNKSICKENNKKYYNKDDIFKSNIIIDQLYENFVVPLEKLREIFNPLKLLIINKIDLNNMRILENVNEELACLGIKRRTIYDEMSKEFEEAKKDYPRAKFQNNYFRISRIEYREEELKKRGYSCISVLKNGVYFITSRLEKLRQNLDEIENETREIEKSIFEEIKSEMAKYVNSIEIYNFIIALIDIYKTFGIKVRLVNYSRPQFSEDKYKIECFFHPMLEQRDYVTNDINFSNNKIICDEEIINSVNTINSDINDTINDKLTLEMKNIKEENKDKIKKNIRKICILTGPNMGGKSTVLKSLSMISLYAQIGCYVPATSAILPIFDKIFLRVGAKDYSSRGLSTFMVEMIDLRKILCSATNKSLILIDELGRGTSAIDGLSLVMAVKEHLAQLDAWTVMATHFSEVGDNLTFNIKMTVNDTVLTYKIHNGIADTSFAINVAKLAKFPDSVIKSTSKYLQEEDLKKY